MTVLSAERDDRVHEVCDTCGSAPVARGCGPHGTRAAPVAVSQYLLPAAALVCVVGDVDVAAVPALRVALDRAVRARPRVIVDLARVSSIEALGLGTLGAGRRMARRRGGDLVLAAPAEVVRTALRSGRRHAEFAIFDTLPQAMTAAAGAVP